MQDLTMKAVTLPEYKGNIIRAMRSLELRESSIPEIEHDEVLIEIEAASVNPSDLAFIQGGYNVRKELPAIPGFEGAGKVIKTGRKAETKLLAGKRVSFFSQSGRGGTWATHIPVRAEDCIAIDDNMPIEQAASFSVNPFTAYAMVQLAIEYGSRTIIQNAAAGQVGKFINALAEMEGMEVINIVRKEEQLEETGYRYVLWTQQEDYREKLSEMATSLEANIAFDAVGGEQTGYILGAMPESSSLFLYGALGARTVSEIPASDVIFRNKSLQGFNMNQWKENLKRDDFDRISSHLQQLFMSGKLKTEIQDIYPLKEYEKALMQYIRSMSSGKVLLKP